MKKWFKNAQYAQLDHWEEIAVQPGSPLDKIGETLKENDFCIDGMGNFYKYEEVEDGSTDVD